MDELPFQILRKLQKLVSGEEKVNQSRFLLAVSGGMDSMVLAHCFLSLDVTFGIAHFNFQLRGEASDLDQDLVSNFCNEYEIIYHSKSTDTEKLARKEKLSTQEMARNLRYEYFDELMHENKYDYVCTAHHGNDQLETFFIHLFRGSGLKGLAGIPQKRDRILRPMLWIPHSEIRAYARQYNVSYREDESNKSNKYLRNRIRHHIIEPMTDINPGHLIKSLHSIGLLKESQDYVDSQVKDFQKIHVDILHKSVERINRIGEITQHSSHHFLLKLYLLDRGLYPDSITDFLTSSGDWKTGSIYEGKFVKAWYDRDNLWIIGDSFYNNWEPNDKIEISPGLSVKLPGGDRIEFLHDSEEPEESYSWIIPVNQNDTSLPLQMRHRKPGDFIELGTSPFFRKSLKKLLNDYKIPRIFKDRLYVLTDSQNNIISVPGMVNSTRYCRRKDSEMKLVYHSRLNFLFKKD